MKKIPILLFFLISFYSFSQDNLFLRGTIRNFGSGRIFLQSYYGEKMTTVDSAVTDASGTFSLRLKPFYKPGLYRLVLGKDQQLDLVLNHETIDFITDSNAPADSLLISSSLENKLFYYFLQESKTDQARLELLMQLVDYYPAKDKFYAQAVSEYENIQMRQQTIVDSLTGKYPASFAVKMFRLQQTPFLLASLSKQERMDYLKQHFFDRIDFADTLLLRSNAWSGKAISYLALYSNNRLTQKQLEGEFIKAVTILMSAASGNPELYKFLLDYLVTGFDRYHFEGVITYMADNFQDPFACEDQARKTALQKKLENFKKISVGKTAPEIEVPDMKGKMIRLSDIRSEYTLIIFWSSECGHCAQMLPKVRDLYYGQKPKKYEILAVSVDSSMTAWSGFLKSEKLDWLNGSDLKGFDSKAADDYNIYATPTMFLLDRDKKILAKPISYKELEQALKEFNLL